MGINGYDDYVAFFVEDIPSIDESFAKRLDLEEKEIKKEKKPNKAFVEKILMVIVLLGYLGLLLYSLKCKIKKRLK